MSSTDAWILVSVVLSNGSLSNIIGNADGLNHAIPTLDELNGSLNRLLANGFIDVAGNRFTSSVLGKRMHKQAARDAGLFDGWLAVIDLLAQRFEQRQPLESTPQVVRIDHCAYERACAAWSEEFERWERPFRKIERFVARLRFWR